MQKAPPQKQMLQGVGALLAASFFLYVLGSSLFWLGGGVPADQLKDDLELLGITDSSAANEFTKIALSVNVVPSQKERGNVEILQSLKGEGSFESLYDDGVDGALTDDYFAVDEANDIFPDLLFNENSVPMGNPKPWCVHLDWSIKQHRSVIDRFVNVKGQPTCKDALNPKYRWNSYDPVTGIDFRPWVQERTNATSAENCPEDSIFKPRHSGNGGLCYRYKIAQAMCILLDFSVNVETASYDWEFVGGCFPDNQIVSYIQAKPGQEYTFDKMPMEVREYR